LPDDLRFSERDAAGHEESEVLGSLKDDASNMKRKIIFWPALICALLLCFVIILPIREEGKRKRKAEIRLLNLIQGQIRSHLDSGGQLPTNWIAISNANPESWKLFTEICEYNWFPPLTEFYTILPHSIDLGPTNLGYARSVFLIRSSSCKWPGRERGRWVCFSSTPKRPEIFGSNLVSRTWIPDKDLPPRIQSQLPTNLKN
jgi:hypothetical protein